MLSTASHKDHTHPLGKTCFAILHRKIPNDNTSFEALWEIYSAYKARGSVSDRVVSYYKKRFADGMLLGGVVEMRDCPTKSPG
jgi:hypothetical protein